MRVAKSVAIGEGLCTGSQNFNEPTGTIIGFSEIKSIARVVAAKVNPRAVGANVQQLEQAGISGSFPGFVVGFGAELSRYYTNQSAKTLLKEFFGQNPPRALDPTHIATIVNDNFQTLCEEVMPVCCIERNVSRGKPFY